MRRVHSFTDRGYKISGRMVIACWITFGTLLVHMVILGTCAFPGGDVTIDGKYLIEEHGKVIELTDGQYWFSYIHGALTLAVFVISFVVIGILYLRGDSKDTYVP